MIHLFVPSTEFVNNFTFVRLIFFYVPFAVFFPTSKYINSTVGKLQVRVKARIKGGGAYGAMAPGSSIIGRLGMGPLDCGDSIFGMRNTQQ